MKKNSLVEDTLFQINNLEDVIKENAQGILQSTMKEEIKSLVKESLMEQTEPPIGNEEEEEEVVDQPEGEDQEMGMESSDDMMDDDEEPGFSDIPSDMDDEDYEEDETIDMTDATPEEVLRVFKAMSDEDGIIVKKDDNMIHLQDDDNEYLIKLTESMRNRNEYDEFDDEEVEDDFEMKYSDDEDDFEIPVKSKMRKPRKFDMDEYEMNGMDLYEMDDEEVSGPLNPDDTIYEIEMDDTEGMEDLYEMDDEVLEMDDMDDMEGLYEMDDEVLEMDDMDDMEGLYEMDDEVLEMDDMDDLVEESKSFKAKGMGMGSASKFKYNKRPNLDQGFDEDMKEGPKHKYTGKAKFEYKEEVNTHGKMKKLSNKKETKEASRTLGSGKRWGKPGLDKPKAAPRHLRKEGVDELRVLRSKNDEYRKALDLFRTKLNEVAVFNSNLAYATRLFTEHSTTKQEKINILKRFDNIETLKESKNLYQSIKGELSSEKSESGNITESIERRVSKAPSNGSAVNLIESKTYENPQFLRMKDLMAKIK
jgi:hypothetical protein